MNFKKANNIAGWVIGGIATLVYLLTMEATASFWDCGEFLSVAAKMEVGHSPGAPLFMMLQRMFAMLAGDNTSLVAPLINSFSAICSGLTILFLFWTITHMAHKLVAGSTVEPDGRQRALILGAGIVGALAYTFSDTFWFSAVEGEVYACSSLFTALTFWAILKWEMVADSRYADRWLILIAYLIGLSLAIHLLNLLCIPAIVMVYYYRRPSSITRQIKGVAYLITSFGYLALRRISNGTWQPSYVKAAEPKSEVTLAGSVTAFICGCVILGFVQWGSLNGLPNMASWLEIMFVNDFGLPFDSGAIFFILLLVGALAALLIIARRINDYLLQRGTLMVIFVVLGISTYVVPMIRSRADVPIDMTNPDGPLTLASYLQREQFGQQPLMYGPDFTAITSLSEKDPKPRYSQSKNPETDGDYYEQVGEKQEYAFDKNRVFPRIWDNNDPNHQRFYADWLDISIARDPRTGRDLTDEYGRPAYDREPTSGDNISFFLGYQMNWMWWRYFMWNYAGRQNDFEGQGDPKNGNWISGIGFVDKMFGRGATNKMADGYVNNGARNQLYFLPLILGILGFIYQFNRNKRDGSVIATLFFFTGIAIGIYLNMTPLQPRERDYAFAGATYAFAIWIGLGVLMVAEWMQKVVKGTASAYIATAICLLLVPTLMLKEEWDDHNRSKKTLARATAMNTLASCDSNAVLFTVGDNETYPLWYAQEIENYRTDVRVINTSLLGIDWYIDQLNYKVNNADAIPMIWKHEDYVGNRQDYIRLQETPAVLKDKYAPGPGGLPLSRLLQFLIDPQYRAPGGDGFFPTASVSLPTLSTDELIARRLLYPEDAPRANTTMNIRLAKGAFQKGQLAQLNIIAAAADGGWRRPIYFSNLQESGAYGNLSDFCRQEGTVYRLMPYSLADSAAATYGESGFIDIKKTQDLFNKVYTYGGAERADVYFDEKNRQMFIPYRLTSARVANQLSSQGKQTQAVQVLDGVMKGITEKSYAYDNVSMFMAQAYYNAGSAGLQKGSVLAQKVAKNASDDAKYILSLSNSGINPSLASDALRDINIIVGLGASAAVAGDKAGSEQMLSMANTVIRQAADAGAETQTLNEYAVRGFVQMYLDPNRRNEADFAELMAAINYLNQLALTTKNTALNQALNSLIQQLNADRRQNAQPVPAPPQG